MREAILAAIYAAIDQVNRQSPERKPVAKSLQTALYGGASALDSLALVNFVVAVEQNIERDLRIPITLVDDRALSSEASPFSTVESLTDFVSQLIEERRNG